MWEQYDDLLPRLASTEPICESGVGKRGDRCTRRSTRLRAIVGMTSLAPSLTCSRFSGRFRCGDHAVFMVLSTTPGLMHTDHGGVRWRREELANCG